jgi:hypothetical protein
VQRQQQPQQLDIGATFTTTRTRPTVVAVITAVLFLVLAVHDYNYRDYPAGEVLVNLVCLVLLIPAVRAWLCVVRRPVELRLTPAELTIHRGDRELSLPWDAIGQIRIEGDLRRPWVGGLAPSHAGPDRGPRVAPAGWRLQALSDRPRAVGEEAWSEGGRAPGGDHGIRSPLP